jgi:hypothetical protein
MQSPTLNIPERDGLTAEKVTAFLIFLSIFVGSSIVFFVEPFEGYFHYLIYLLLLPFFISRYGLPRTPFQMLFIPLVVGAFEVGIGNNDIFLFVKIFGGILLSVSFYYYVMQYFDMNVERMFRLYLSWAYWCAIIGIFQFICYKAGFKPGYDYSAILNKGNFVVSGGVIRVSSIFPEPSQLGIMLGPAAFICAINILRRKNYVYKNYQNIIILVALYLSKSSTGYLGLFFAIVIIGINLGYLVYLFAFLAIGFFAGYGLYNTVDEFKLRVDSSTSLWVDNDLSYQNVSTSSFVLYNNAHVAWFNFKEHPLFGTGLGSHPIAYNKFSYTKKEVIHIKGIDSNMKDANSMFLRIMSETGLLGVIFILGIVFKCFVGFTADENDNHWIISGALLVIILLYLLRQGNYFLNGFPFFVWLYYYTKLSSVKYAEEKNEAAAIESAGA